MLFVLCETKKILKRWLRSSPRSIVPIVSRPTKYDPEFNSLRPVLLHLIPAVLTRPYFSKKFQAE